MGEYLECQAYFSINGEWQKAAFYLKTSEDGPWVPGVAYVKKG